MKFTRLMASLVLLHMMVAIRAEAADTVDKCGLTALPDTIAAPLRDLLPAQDDPATADQLDAAVDTLRRQGIRPAAIIDYLVTAHCPTDAMETSDQKRSYAKYIRDLVYARENESEIVVNVPLTPRVMDAAIAKAHDADLSPEAWIAQTVTQAAGVR